MAIVSIHWAWPSCEGMWTALRRRRQSPSDGSESADGLAESQGHLLGMLGSEGREMGTAGAPNVCYCYVALQGDTPTVGCMPFWGRDMAIQVGHMFLYNAALFYDTICFAFYRKTFLASSQQPAATNKLAVRLGLCFLFWDRRLFAEGCAQSTTFWYASCNFAAAGRRQKMPPTGWQSVT